MQDKVTLESNWVFLLSLQDMSRNRERGDQVETKMSVRPPPFMETAVSGWFAILDAQFHLANISCGGTKFFHVLASLPADVVARVDPTVIAGQDFSSLKNVVIEMFEKSKPELFEKLISKNVMTGRPSEFLGELRDVASKVGVGDDLVRHKFIQSLPPAMSTVLAAQRDLTIVQMGKLADELVPLVQRQTLVAAHPAHEPRSGSRPPTRGVSPAVRGRRPRSAERRGPGGDLEPYHEGQPPRVCRAHIFYGSDARTCRPWCTWPDKNSRNRMTVRERDPTPAGERHDSENYSGRL